MNKRTHAITHFLMLGAILSSAVLAFLLLKGNTLIQLFIGIVLAVSYTLWGAIYHHFEGDLHLRVVIEYIFIGAISVLLIMTVLGY
ncbi:hypothetical protein A2154_03535 [Candidatus Gottesmanbacteria bacterium RBG_16_43_7]|uniref:Uncharacterized protein n=1 Tax=Candidatus Gottesmanbacteria bacterium RBG_16_43_7 TaxID=1798373 RepID=A0A1F5Z7F7_9BACT|nr:MAG: hypothetical protein A2154_03535 [Candidatus Gottesmanbacteria bacterium RBG_16_43_7]